MQKTLATLIKLHRRALDEKRQTMAQLENKREALEKEHSDLDAALLREGELSEDSPEIRFSYSSFAYRVRTRQEEIRRAIAAYTKEIEAVREQIRAEFAELKKFEIMRDHNAQELLQESKRQEQNILDEIGGIAFARKGE
jgi:flagellar FliJ protein